MQRSIPVMPLEVQRWTGMKAVEILRIEDNRADAKLTQEALNVASVPSHLTVVADGVDAMAFLRWEGPYADALVPDLIVMDMHLPRLGGDWISWKRSGLMTASKRSRSWC